LIYVHNTADGCEQQYSNLAFGLLCSFMIDSDISDRVIGTSISVMYVCISLHIYMYVESFKIQVRGEVALVHTMKEYGELGVFYLHCLFIFSHSVNPYK
jgi:hypothetical protein